MERIGGDLIEVKFWAKLASNKQSAAERQPIRGIYITYPFSVRYTFYSTKTVDHISLYFSEGKINCKTNIGSQTLHMMGVNGCDLLENEWFRYHATADISLC